MATSSTTHLHISGISVDSSGFQTPIRRDAGAVNTLYEMKFDTPMNLSREDTLLLRLLYKKRFAKDDLAEIKFDTKEIFRACGANQEHEYRKSYDGIAIVTISLVGNTSTERAGQPASSHEESLDLHPTTDDIIKICTRFRILVIGMAGVGKSSFINSAFGVQNALASNDKPGEANIETEFILQNDKLVLHHSEGFGPGDKKNVKTVREFIQRRRDMLALNDKLHAVWLFFEIPRPDGHLLETGTEDFLRLKRDGQLGNIPVVVVLTKYDMLLGRVDSTLDKSALVGLSDDDVKEYIKQKADAELQETCIKPLERSAGPGIPWAAVSKKEEHRDTIAHLIQITEDCVRQYVATEAPVMTVVAQRDPMLNIKTSIEAAHRHSLTAAFKRQTVYACLEVLHTDIVRVWNFRDPHNYLMSKEFKTSVVELVDQLDFELLANPNRTMTGGLSPVGVIAGIVSVLSGTTVPIVVLRHFIAYIVDLITILQMLFVSNNEEVAQRMIKLAVAAYCNSSMVEVHGRIKKYADSLPPRNRLDREMFAMMEELVNEFSVRRSDIQELRANIPVISSQPDEPW